MQGALAPSAARQHLFRNTTVSAGAPEVIEGVGLGARSRPHHGAHPQGWRSPPDADPDGLNSYSFERRQGLHLVLARAEGGEVRHALGRNPSRKGYEAAASTSKK